jgi:hypothetical protein
MDAGTLDTYKAAVLAAAQNDGPETPDPAMLVDANRLAADFARDLATARRRFLAAAELADLPRLERELQAAQQTANKVLPYASRATKNLTAGALLELLNLVGAGALPLEHVRPRDLRDAINSTRAGALNALRETASLSLARQLSALNGKRSGIENSIQAAERLANSAERIAVQRSICERLAAGERPISVLGVEEYGKRSEVIFSRERAKLDALVAESAGKDDAAQKLLDLHGQLADLGRQQAELESERLRPENMAWAGERIEAE